MASMKFHKDCKRWRVFWHVTSPDGSIDKGSKSFTDKTSAHEFKLHCEKNEKLFKRAITVKQIDLSDAVQEWKGFCQSYTEETRNSYIEYMDKFIAALPDNVIYITDLTKLHINIYLNSLMSRKLKNKTINNHLCSIKSLCKFMMENYNIPNPAQGIKKFKEDPPKVNFLTLEDYHKVLSNCSDSLKPHYRFIANTGLRVAEFCNLKWENCDLTHKTITVIGKGRKKRTITLNETAFEIVKNAKESKKGTDGHVFLRWNGGGLSRFCLSSSIRKACCNSGLSGGGPHALRHFFATQLLLKGVPIIKVSMLLGHSSISITQKHYSHILSRDLAGITSVLDGL
jgi:site-specific recombinase XerD